MNSKKYALGLAVVTLAFLCLSARADESLWVYTQGTDTRPAGSTEVKLGGILRNGKDSGHYRFYDIRPEVEYGITDRFTIGAELIIFHHDYAVDDPDLEPLFGTQGGEGGSFESTQNGGFELTGKYNILSPYKDPLGLTLGFSYERRWVYRLDGSDISQDSYVPTVYLQKNFLDDTLIFAFKGKLEFEIRESPGVREEEIAPDVALGVSYRVAPKWYVGLETRYQSDFLEPEEEGEPAPENPSEFTPLWNLEFGTQFQQALYAGPAVHYAEERWFVTAGILWQVWGDGDNSNPSVSGGKVWDEHEEVHAGLTAAYNY